MVGQGRPSTRNSLAPWIVRLMAWLVAALLPAQVHSLLAAEPTLTLRIAWGGGAERQWNGSIVVDQGTLSIVRPLAIVADAPGSIWNDGDNRIEIRERSSRAYDGVDVEVASPLTAHLKVTLAADSDAQGVAVEVPLSELVDKTRRESIDKQRNQLMIRRSPGDILRISMNRDSLIFAPGEIWDLDVLPQQLSTAAGTAVHFKSRLVPARGGVETWSQEQTVKWPAAGEAGPTITLQVAMPTVEGAYDLVVEASERGGLPLRLTKVLAERRVQLVVLAPQPPEEPPSTPWTQVMEIDPTSSHWYDIRRAIPKLPSFIPYANSIWQGPLVNGSMTAVTRPAGRAMELSASPPGDDPSWVAYPLSGAKPGMPHMLEVDYPADQAQTLGISIVEPNAAGNVTPYGLDSGVYTPDEPLGDSAGWSKHRLLFWPRSSSPLLLLTNRREGKSAAFGKIRLLAGPGRLPRAFAKTDPPSARMLAGFMNRPYFADNFSASESLDPVSGRSLTDWETFFEGGTRLVEYLDSVGYNAVMLNVYSEGSTIYPSRLLDSTPRFDTGTFFDQAHDPMRKDVLELLLRLFDREQLKLIPTLEFSTPLPELEAIVRAGRPAADGIQLIGPDGLPWTDSHSSHHGLEPYYNPLDERVERAMLAVVHELVERYGKHPSMAGLGLTLSAYGYAQLPGDIWGLDDQTIHRFERDMRVNVGGGDGPTRFAARAQFVSGPGRLQWRAWRCAVLADFHRRIAKELTAARNDARLYLAPTDMLDQPELTRELRPSLPPSGNVLDAMESVGIRAGLYYNNSQIVLLRPQQVEPPGLLTAQAAMIETNRSAEWDRVIAAGPAPASLQYQEPQRLRLATFDANSPLGKDKTYAALVSQISPSQALNRQRFAHSLATLDAQAVFDGGWWLPLGQEEMLRDWVAAYRQLPQGKCYTIPNCPQPLTMRSAQTAAGTVAYLVNDSRWKIVAQVQTNAPAASGPLELGGKHENSLLGTVWTVELRPYDLAVYQFAARNVQFFAPQVDMSEARATLAAAVDDLKERRKVLDSPPSFLNLSNPGFESPMSGSQIPGWTVTGGGTATLEPNGPYEGKQSLRLVSGGGWTTLRSEPFAVPKTGRLTVSFWAKVENAAVQPQVRLVLEGFPSNRQFFQTAPVGAATTHPFEEQWKQVVFLVDDVPAEGLQQIRFRLDLAGQTNLLIDHVQLFDLFFNNPEQLQLNKIIALADFQLKQNQLGDCQYELEGYWPRFLRATVPLPGTALAAPQPAPPDKSAAKPGVVGRVKGLLKL